MDEEVLTRKSRRRSVRIKRQSIGISLLASGDCTSADPPLKSSEEDVITVNSGNNDALETRDDLYGSIWMETNSPVVSKVNQGRRRSRLHSDLAIVQLTSASVESERDQDRLSIEILRDVNRDEIETADCGRLDEYKLPVSLRELGVSPSSPKYRNSPSSPKYRNTLSPNLELEINNTMISNQCSAKGNSNNERKHILSPLATRFPCNSFSDGSMNDNSLYSNGSLSPCYDSLLPTMKHLESAQTLDNFHQDNISPIVGLPSSSPGSTPYSPSQAVCSYVSPQTPNCHCDQSVHLTPTTTPRLQIESPQRWEISPSKISDEAGGFFVKRGDKSTVKSRRKSVKKQSVKKSTVLSPTSNKKEVRGFLSICKVFAEKLVSAVKQSPDTAQSQAENRESDNSKSPLSDSSKSPFSDNSKSPLKNLDKELEEILIDSTAALTNSETSNGEELEIEDQAGVYTGKIDQAGVYTGKIDQAGVYTGKIDQAGVHTGKTSESDVEHKKSPGKITNCKFAEDWENEKGIQNDCGENPETNESFLVSGSKHSSVFLLKQKDVSVCEKQPNNIISDYSSSGPCPNQITEAHDIKPDLVEKQNIPSLITSNDVGAGSVKLDGLFVKEQEIVKMTDDLIEKSNREKGLVDHVAEIDCLITDRKQSKQNMKPLRRRGRHWKSLDVTQIKSTNDIMCSTESASICQQNSPAMTSPESISAGALCVVSKGENSEEDTLHMSSQPSLSDFTAEADSKLKRRGRRPRKSLDVSSLSVTAIQDLENLKCMTTVSEEADIDVNNDTCSEYLDHQQREIQIKQSTRINTKVGDSNNDGQEIDVENVDCIVGKYNVDVHQSREYFWESSTSDLDTSRKKRPKIKPLSEDVLRELDEYLGIKPCNTGTEISGKRRRKPMGRNEVSSQSCDKTTDNDCANLTQFDESCLQIESNSNIITGVSDVLNKVKKRRGRPRKCSEPPQAIEEESDNVEQDCLEIESQKSLEVERVAQRTTRLRRRSGELYKRSQTKNLTEESSSPAADGDQVCGAEVLVSRVESVQSASNLHKKRKQKKSENSLEDIYRNKNFERPTEKTWETIYEDPLSNGSSEQFFGKKRFRRAVDFNSIAPGKAKKRKQKARKVGLNPKQWRRQSLSYEVAADKIEKMTQELKEFECNL